LEDNSKMSVDGKHVETLRESRKAVGELIPCIRSGRGNIVDGLHRKAAHPDWFEVVLKQLDSEEKELAFRIVVNLIRRSVSEEEKKELLNKYAKLTKKKPTEIAQSLGLPYTTIMRYLEPEVKERPEKGGPKPKTTEEEAKPCEKRLAEAPRASDFRRPTYTDKHVELLALLANRGFKIKGSEVPILREGEYTADGKPKAYQIDILLEPNFAVEVEGEGSSSKDNEERNQYLKSKGFEVIHVANEEVGEQAIKKIEAYVSGVIYVCPACGQTLKIKHVGQQHKVVEL